MGKTFKRLVIVTGSLLLLAGAPIVQANPLGEYVNTLQSPFTITAQAAELPYSTNWETQSDGSWKYKLTSGGYASGWIQDEVDQNWYYMDASQTMLSGLVKSNENHYYLLSQIHDGHFGRMVTNGMTYNGITIQAETSGAYVGALTETTLNQLRSLGLTVEGARDVSGSQHVSDGKVTSGGSTSQNDTGNNQETQTNTEGLSDYEKQYIDAMKNINWDDWSMGGNNNDWR